MQTTVQEVKEENLSLKVQHASTGVSEGEETEQEGPTLEGNMAEGVRKDTSLPSENEQGVLSGMNESKNPRVFTVPLVSI
jgi:hypothetical protein